MAVLDFPDSPTLNDIYTANNKSWIWNGSAWIPKPSTWSQTSLSATTPVTYNSATATIGLGPVDGGTA